MSPRRWKPDTRFVVRRTTAWGNSLPADPTRVRLDPEVRSAFAERERSLGEVFGGRCPTDVDSEEMKRLTPSVDGVLAGRQPYVRWKVPVRWHTLDPRPLHLFRRAYYERGRRVPLVVQCGGRREEWGADEVRCWDQLALSLERLWLAEWADVPRGERPGLLLIRPDGGTILHAPVEARMRPTVGALACCAVVTSREVRWAMEVQEDEALLPTEAARLVRLFESQGLLVRLEGPAERMPLPGDEDRRAGTRGRYASLLAQTLLRTTTPPLAGRQSRRVRLDVRRMTELRIWRALTDRLREAGLRSI